MTEFYVELQDANGTGYCTTYPFSDETIYFEDLEEVRMYAKSRVSDEYILARVIESGRGNVVDFFQK